MITRYRYAWEPQTYHQTDIGAPTGGGKPAAQGQTAGGDGGDEGKQGEEKGGDDGKADPPAVDAKFTQADLDRIVAQRLEEEKGREKKRTDKARQEAAEEAARKNGEWETVASSRQERITALEGEVESLRAQLTERDTAIVRSKIAAKHRIPALFVDRIRGTTEQEMDADAKEMARNLPAPTAPETEAGRGNGKGGRATLETEKQAQLATGRYGKIA